MARTHPAENQINGASTADPSNTPAVASSSSTAQARLQTSMSNLQIAQDGKPEPKATPQQAMQQPQQQKGPPEDLILMLMRKGLESSKQRREDESKK